ncbi:MAG: flagellar basal body protein [Pseudomonadota bacterium]
MIIDDVTSQLASWGLNRLMAQQAITAQNIANANVKGYQAMTLDFSAQVDALKNSVSEDVIMQNLASMRNHQPQAQVINSDIFGEKAVELDEEIAASTANTLQYQALVESLNKHFGLMQLAITGRTS